MSCSVLERNKSTFPRAGRRNWLIIFDDGADKADLNCARLRKFFIGAFDERNFVQRF